MASLNSTNVTNPQESTKGNAFDISAMQKLEELAMEAFRLSGYEVRPPNRRQPTVDFEAIRDSEKLVVTIKHSSSILYRQGMLIQHSSKLLTAYAEQYGFEPVLIILALLSRENRESLTSTHTNLRILDVSNMLYVVQGTSMEDEFVGALSYSVTQVVPKDGGISLGWIEHEDEYASIKRMLRECPEGKSGWVEFEDLCFRALKKSFSGELALWHRQRESNCRLYRFDLICRIKDNVRESFWSMIEGHFNSKYVVFEFKNHSHPITQKEVYTTERYLYKKALRNVAIIISRNGYDDHAHWAAKGSLRESGKLILLLTIIDLVEILDLSSNQNDPSSYLLDKVDELLINLEK